MIFDIEGLIKALREKKVIQEYDFITEQWGPFNDGATPLLELCSRCHLRHFRVEPQKGVKA